MTLTLALNNALTGLRVNERTMAVISNNIANANTEGYSRQVVDLASVSVDGVGSGVRIEEIVRKVDNFLQASIQTQTAEYSYNKTVTDFYDQVQILMGEPGSSNSIDEYVETFFNSLQQLAETPERTSSRALAVDSATFLANEMSGLAESLESLRLQADREFSSAVARVNSIVERLFSTNEALASADAFGSSKATLLDERDQLMDELSSYIEIEYHERDNGTVHIYAGEGLNVLDEGFGQFSYTKIGDISTLTTDGTLGGLTMQSIDQFGKNIGLPIEFMSSAKSGDAIRKFDSGELSALLDMRDTILPDMLSQLDILSSTIRDEFNKIHNNGSGYPGRSELVGTTLVDARLEDFWTGSTRIAVLNDDGTPAASRYPDETSPIRPLTLDFESLYNGTEYGKPDVQMMIDEINHHYGIPQNRMKLGDLNNVELAMITDTIPNLPPSLTFDFDIENISGGDAEFWVDDIVIRDDTNLNISDVALGGVSLDIPTIDLAATNTFTTTAGSDLVRVRTSNAHQLSEGDLVRFSDPGVAIDGIPGASFEEYFEVTNISDDAFDIRLPSAAVAGAITSVASQQILPPYTVVEAGSQKRLHQSGTITADLSANAGSTYYDIDVSMATRASDGTISYAEVTYRINTPQQDLLNDRFAVRSATRDGSVVLPRDYRPILKASLVDENGRELPIVNGNYQYTEGYLKLESLIDGTTLAIDELDSSHQGDASAYNPREGSGRGFSHHFGLNNFFVANDPTPAGEALANSALNFEVDQVFKNTPSYITTGNLQRSNQPSAAGSDPLYTYERFSGDQSAILQLAELGTRSFTFGEAGALPSSTQTLISYSAEFIGYNSANAIGSFTQLENSEIILEGYRERADAISGVNLDEELANTIIYQNAYTANARVITVTDELFDALIGAFR